MDRSVRKAIAWWLVLAMAVSLFGGLPASGAAGPITVGEAIANNAGTATVEGYIVAHTTGTNAYDFAAPFGNDFNVALADDPTERSASKLLPVQLPSAFRAQFGLMTNPGNIGKKIRVTGELSAYFAVPGLRSPTAIEFAGGGDPDPDPVVASIAEARGMVGKTVTIQGVVTADNAAIGGSNLSTYVQDATAGINVFSFEPESHPELRAGDVVRITGGVATFRGLTEIVPEPAGIEVLSTGATLPSPVPATIAELTDAATAEPLEGRLVNVAGYVTNVPASPAGGGYNVAIVDASFRGLTLRVMEGTNAIASIEKGVWYEFTGVASQYDSYQVLPRGASDIVPLDPQPAPPNGSGTYAATVAAITDGDTIRLTSPVLGSTSVRFLNVDTAETYHSVVTEADANQKRHGEAAKAYLGTLLQVGDQVTLEVGEEPTDEYGRLLAEVIRASDGLNVNLEMVKQGQAVTYYIWPIDDSYETYAAAVKAASDARLGIWDEDDPLMELPFVFRAREQQKGLLRYVGDYGDKTYVEPQRWADVPVERRVFFASAAEAEANGYVPADGHEPPGETLKVQLLGVNDWHGKIDLTSTVSGSPGATFGRADYLAAYLKAREAANPNTLIMHSGDMIGGSSPVSALLQDEPSVDIMEAIGFDVGTLGNHEFDEGVDELLRMIRGGEHPEGTTGYDGMNFPIVAANVEYKHNGELMIEPYTVLEVGGARIGFIGVVTTETPNIVMPSGIESVRFTDEAEAVNRYVPELKAQGVEAIVVLAHVPGSQAGETASGDIAALATNVDDEVDVIFAAHNHVKVNAIVDGKLIVQAWEYGNAFVDVDLDIDPRTGDVVAKTADIVDVVQQGATPDADVANILDHYLALVAPKVNAVVGTSAFAMSKGYPNKQAFGDLPLGNFIADGMKAAMDADVALMNGGGVRDNLDAGPITWGELFNVQPFGNTLVRLEVTGAQLVDILNAMIHPQYGPDSFIGGMRYTWDASTNKVVKLMDEDGEPVDLDATYRLVVNNFMFNQTNDRYKRLQQYGRNVAQGPEDIEATVAYAKSFGGAPIAYEAEGRISTDIVSPETTASVQEQDGVVTFAAADAGVGVLYTEYRVDGGEWTRGGQVTFEQDGEYVVEYRSADRVYNLESAKSLEIAIDRQGPDIAAVGDLEVYQYEAAAVRIVASDEGSGVADISVSVDGVTDDVYVEAKPFALSLGAHDIVVTAVDRAGNATTETFRLVVATDAAHLDELIVSGVERGWIEEQLQRSLIAKVEQLQNESDKSRNVAAKKAIRQEIEAQRGKKIDEAFAALLLEHLEAIESGASK